MSDYGVAIRQQQEHGEAWVCSVCGKTHTVRWVFPCKDEAKKEEKGDESD